MTSGGEVVGEGVGEEGAHRALHVEVEHAIGERGAHVVADRAVEGGVAGGDDHPAVRQAVVADPPVEDQRVGRGLQALVGGGQLVEEENAFGQIGAGQELGVGTRRCGAPRRRRRSPRAGPPARSSSAGDRPAAPLRRRRAGARSRTCRRPRVPQSIVARWRRRGSRYCATRAAASVSTATGGMLSGSSCIRRASPRPRASGRRRADVAAAGSRAPGSHACSSAPRPPSSAATARAPVGASRHRSETRTASSAA